jgi:hypothetical protein
MEQQQKTKSVLTIDEYNNNIYIKKKQSIIYTVIYIEINNDHLNISFISNDGSFTQVLAT